MSAFLLETRTINDFSTSLKSIKTGRIFWTFLEFKSLTGYSRELTLLNFTVWSTPCFSKLFHWCKSPSSGKPQMLLKSTQPCLFIHFSTDPLRGTRISRIIIFVCNLTYHCYQQRNTRRLERGGVAAVDWMRAQFDNNTVLMPWSRTCFRDPILPRWRVKRLCRWCSYTKSKFTRIRPRNISTPLPPSPLLRYYPTACCSLVVCYCSRL